jgi:hypothetical protein
VLVNQASQVLRAHRCYDAPRGVPSR